MHEVKSKDVSEDFWSHKKYVNSVIIQLSPNSMIIQMN